VSLHLPFIYLLLLLFMFITVLGKCKFLLRVVVIEKKPQDWSHLDFPFTGKVTIVDRILTKGHIYYSSYLFPSHETYKWLEFILKIFLLDKQGGQRDRFGGMGCMHIIEGARRLGLSDMKSQGAILAYKWLVRMVVGGAPWQFLV
jgi:hypothetical protein